MIVSNWALQATVRGFARLAAALRSGGEPLPAAPSQDGVVPLQVREDYVSSIFQALALFRFFTFTMGVSLIFVVGSGKQPEILKFLFVVGAGLYNVFRVVWRVNPVFSRPLFQWLSLGTDVTLGVTLVLLYGGLDSAFLIYSLSPILTASLLLDASRSLSVALITALSITGAYVAGGLHIGGFPGLLSGNYLAVALLYIGFCTLIAYLPFLANLNWQRRVRSESLATERRRLRREVHDNVAQTLAFLKLKMSRAEERVAEAKTPLNARDVADIGSAVERAYLAVRDYLDDRQELVNDESLSASLATAANEWSRDTGLPVQIISTGVESHLSPKVKLQILQIAREALANVAKHARSNHVWISVEHSDTGVTVRVKDDGRGFSQSQPRGHGTGIMKERAAMVGASVSLYSEPGKGTEVVVGYPRPAESTQA